MSEMKLERIVPQHKKTASFLWVRSDFMPMSQKFRDIRESMREPRDSHKCWWCKRKFEDGDMMGLAAQKAKGNVLLCQTCCIAAKGTVA